MNSKNEAFNNNLLKYWFSNDLIKKIELLLVNYIHPKYWFVIYHMYLQELMVPISSDNFFFDN